MSEKIGDYSVLLAGLRDEIVAAQGRAARAVNTELLLLYWRIGTLVAEAQGKAGWGSGLIPRLSRDLKSQLPEAKGFSERNLGYMVRFAREYGDCPPREVTMSFSRMEPAKPPAAAEASNGNPILQPSVAKLRSEDQALLLSLPWAHNLILIDRLPDIAARIWYARAAREAAWSRDRLIKEIQGKAIERRGSKTDNFAAILPETEAEQVRKSLKDPYLFGFLSLDEDFRERELEAGLVAQLKDFLVELGVSFAFVGSQYRLELEGEEYYLDLLFYHLKLRRYVVVELKRGCFLPEYAGKLNFYLNLVDDRLRVDGDGPSIGLILCQDKSRVVAEYSLRGLDKAIGVSEYQLTQSLPESLASSLPRIEDIEAELSGIEGEVE